MASGRTDQTDTSISDCCLEQSGIFHLLLPELFKCHKKNMNDIILILSNLLIIAFFDKSFYCFVCLNVVETGGRQWHSQVPTNQLYKDSHFPGGNKTYYLP